MIKLNQGCLGLIFEGYRNVKVFGDIWQLCQHVMEKFSKNWTSVRVTKGCHLEDILGPSTATTFGYVEKRV